MGKFLRDQEGRMVALEGTPVLEKTLDRKPRDCQGCGFARWAKGDKLFILSGNEWLCPDCAVAKGLSIEHYHRNYYATQPPPPGYVGTNKNSTAEAMMAMMRVNNSNNSIVAPGATPNTLRQQQRKQSTFGECFACMCYF